MRLPRSRDTVSRSCVAVGGPSLCSRGACASITSPPSVTMLLTTATWTRLVMLALLGVIVEYRGHECCWQRAKTYCAVEPLDGAEKTCFRPALAAHVYLSSWLPTSSPEQRLQHVFTGFRQSRRSQGSSAQHVLARIKHQRG